MTTTLIITLIIVGLIVWVLKAAAGFFKWVGFASLVLLLCLVWTFKAAFGATSPANSNVAASHQGGTATDPTATPGVTQNGLFNTFTPPQPPQPKETDPLDIKTNKVHWSDEVSLRIGWGINWKAPQGVTSLLIKADNDLIEQNQDGYWKIEGDTRTKLSSLPNAANWRFKVPPTCAKNSFVVEVERKPM